MCRSNSKLTERDGDRIRKLASTEMGGSCTLGVDESGRRVPVLDAANGLAATWKTTLVTAASHPGTGTSVHSFPRHGANFAQCSSVFGNSFPVVAPGHAGESRPETCWMRDSAWKQTAVSTEGCHTAPVSLLPGHRCTDPGHRLLLPARTDLLGPGRRQNPDIRQRERLEGAG